MLGPRRMVRPPRRKRMPAVIAAARLSGRYSPAPPAARPSPANFKNSRRRRVIAASNAILHGASSQLALSIGQLDFRWIGAGSPQTVAEHSVDIHKLIRGQDRAGVAQPRLRLGPFAAQPGMPASRAYVATWFAAVAISARQGWTAVGQLVRRAMRAAGSLASPHSRRANCAGRVAHEIGCSSRTGPAAEPSRSSARRWSCSYRGRRTGPRNGWRCSRCVIRYTLRCSEG